MPEVPNENREETKEPVESAEDPAWSLDQKKRPYYYDDACGYEEYVPDEDVAADLDDDEIEP